MVFRCTGKCFAKTDSRPCAFRPASLRAGFFLLLVQEKETKEKDIPTAPPAAHRARAPAGLVVRRLPALTETRKIQSSALLRADAELIRARPRNWR